MSRYSWQVVVIVVFLVLAVASNWLTATYGFVPVGLGLTATAGTWCAGLVLLARDLVPDVAGRTTAVLAIVASAGPSAVLAGPRLAVVSAVAFAVSEAADLLVYEPLRRNWAISMFKRRAGTSPSSTKTPSATTRHTSNSGARSGPARNTCRARAEAENWLGEIEGIDLTLSFLRSKRDQAQRQTRRPLIQLGLPQPREASS